MEGGVAMNSTTIAVDVAKSVFEVAVSEQPGEVRERQRLSRERFRRFLAERPPATVLMEACGSAHHWARQAQAHGHRAVLVPPPVVRPYVLRNKTDRTDTKGLLEAFRNEDVRPVPVKSETKQALPALHRLTPRFRDCCGPRGPPRPRTSGRSRHACGPLSTTSRASPARMWSSVSSARFRGSGC